MSPCCGGSLQSGAKAIAITQLMLMGLFFLGTFVAVEESACDDDSAELGAIVLVVGVVASITPLSLLIGAIKRNQALCMVWFIVTIMGLVYEVYVIMMQISYWDVVTATADGKQNFIAEVIVTLLFSYFLWVVGAFMRELGKEHRGSDPNLPYGNITKV